MINQTSPRSSKTILAVLLASTLFVLSACGFSGSSLVSKEPPTPEPPVVNITEGEVYNDFSSPITVTSPQGILTAVSMTNQEGAEIEGEFTPDNTQWSSSQKLGYSRTYTVTASNEDGTTTRTFSTVTPDAQQDAYLAPLDGSTVGVGQVIALRFDSAVQDRQAVQNAITVKTTPEVDGAFYWISNQEVRWRPENFWEPGTQVEVIADLYGTEIGPGVYGASDRNATFTIGDKVEAIADDSTKTLSVYRNGVLERSMPMSMGEDINNPTPNGTYVIGDQYPTLMMDSSTFGLTGSGGYKTEVEYATQMSYSGIYIHAAPWSVGQQGYTNVSHGCINVTTENAQWVYNNMERGDIVIVKNSTGPTLSGIDGLGDWNIPWSEWSAGNAAA